MSFRSPLSVVAVALLLVSGGAVAKSYPVEELKRMVEAGNTPEQGEQETVRDEEMAFQACVAGKARVLEAASADYPTAQVLRSPVTEIDTLWTPDAVMQITCGNGRMKITRAPYR
ncbi:hypothetical protein [Coralloluteibacterium thermophilus]|uniref:DUF732 domain-containing protein n=1 Tax=Coralloluteibacterium thermophilum TaxID=2707049 RepID=A0ABV9NJ40_9GAMM